LFPAYILHQYQPDVLHIMQQFAKVEKEMPAAAVLAHVLLAIIYWVSNAVRQHWNTAQHAICYTLVLTNENIEVAKKWCQQ
jgi:diacylglycerol kinase